MRVGLVIDVEVLVGVFSHTPQLAAGKHAANPEPELGVVQEDLAWPFRPLAERRVARRHVVGADGRATLRELVVHVRLVEQMPPSDASIVRQALVPPFVVHLEHTPAGDALLPEPRIERDPGAEEERRAVDAADEVPIHARLAEHADRVGERVELARDDEAPVTLLQRIEYVTDDPCRPEIEVRLNKLVHCRARSDELFGVGGLVRQVAASAHRRSPEELGSHDLDARSVVERVELVRAHYPELRHAVVDRRHRLAV